MKLEDYNYFIKKIDKVTTYISPKKDARQYLICQTFAQIGLFFRRLANYAFGDHYWYNDALAQQIVARYYANEEFQNNELNAKIDKIADRFGILKPITDSIDPEELVSDIDDFVNSSDSDSIDSEELSDDDFNSILFPKVNQKKFKEPAYRTLDPVKIPASKKMSFHILADTFGNNSELEGLARGEAVKYFNAYLNAHDTQKIAFEGITEDLREMITKATEIVSAENFQEKMKEEIKNAFLNKKRLLIPGGWSGMPGHAIYYEMIPTSANEASWRLFNRGPGTQNHESKQFGVKAKYQSCVEWQGIKMEKLLNPTFLEALDQTIHATITPDKIKTEYHASDIYGALKDLLNPTRTVSLEELKPELSLQHAGTCEWKSFLTFLYTYMNFNDYTSLVHEMERHRLIEDVHSKEVPDVMTYRLIKKGTEKFCRSLSKLKKQNFIDSENFLHIKNSLKPVFAWIKKYKPLIYPTQSLELPAQFEPLPDDLLEIPLAEKIDPPKNFTLQEFENSELVDFCRHVDFSKSSPLKILEEAVPLFQQAWEKGYDLSLATGCLHLLKKFSVDRKDYEKITQDSPEKAKEMIIALGKLGELFFKSCFTVPSAVQLHSEKFYSLIKIFKIQEHLTQNLSKKYKNGFKFLDCFRNLIKSNRSLFFRLYDTQAHLEMNQILNVPQFLDASAKMQTQFLFSDISVWEERCVYNFFNKYLYPFTSDSLPPLIENFDKKIRQQYPNFDDLTSFQQDARLYTSHDLPEWFKSLRDTHFRLNFLAEGPIASPPFLDRSNDLSFSWSFKDNEDYCRLHWNLKLPSQEIYNHFPYVAEIEKNPTNRFVNLHREFQSHGLQQLMRYLSKTFSSSRGFLWGEKDLLTILFCQLQIDFPEEEGKEILHIFAASELQIVEGLEYFTKYPEKLSDLDYQTLFKIIFFENGQLATLLKNHPEFAHRLSQFIQSHLKAFHIQNDYQGTAFLLQISRYLSPFCKSLGCEPHNPEFPDVRNILHTLLNQEDLLPQDKSILSAELLAGYSREETLSEDDLKDLLEAYVQITQYPIPEKLSDPEIQKEIRETLMVHQTAIKKYLGSESLHSYISAKIKELPLPVRIVENPYFNSLFPNKTHYVPSKDGFYNFIDDLGFQTRVALAKDEVCIEREINGQWHSFVPPEKLTQKGDKDEIKTGLLSRHLINDYHHWLSPSSDLLLITHPNNGKTEYKASIDTSSRRVTSIEDCQDNTQLSHPSILFTHFEDPSYIEEWFDPLTQQLKKVHLPRFGLSFTVKESDPPQLICEQFAGYRLKLNNSISCLGIYSHYLVLENDKGVTKVLLPDDTFQIPKKYEVLIPRYIRNQKLSLGDHSKRKYIACELQNNGNLIPDKKKDAFILTQIFTLVQEYGSAAKTLKKQGEKLDLYTKGEQTALRSIIDENITGDKDPNVFALRTYAGYLLCKNFLSKGVSCPEIDLLELRKNYFHYLQLYQHITELKMNREEELFILRTLLSQEYHSAFAARLKELSPEENFSNESDNVLSPQSISLKDLKSLLGHKKEAPKKGTYFISRPQKVLSEQFLYFFKVAKEGSKEDREHLDNMLIFLKHSPQESDRALYQLYSTIKKFPEKFPHYNSYFDSWKEDTLSTASQLLEKTEYNQTKLKQNVYIEVPLEEKNEDPEPYRLNFTLSPIEQFHKEKEAWIEEMEVKEDSSLIELKTFFENEILKEGPEKSDLEKLFQDLTQYLKHPPKLYELKNKGLQSIKEAAHKGKSEEAQELEKLQLEIMDLANTKPTSHKKRAELRILQKGGLHKPLTLEEVLFCFGRQDSLPLQKRNSALSEKQVNQLFEKIGCFLLKSTHQQQRQRVLTLLEKVEKSECPEEKHSLLQELGAALKDRAYAIDAQTNPNYAAYLVFEYYANILLRFDQVDKLYEYLKSGNTNLIMEMIMGAGKSKVLLPLLALLRADGKNLSLVIATEALCASLVNDTQDILGSAFDQKVHHFNFYRNTDCSPSNLRNILDILESAIKNRDCLIISSKTLGCLALKFIEKKLKSIYQNDKEESEELQWMKKIICLIRKQGVPLLDEADTILNILHEICFSIGDPIAPSADDCQIISLIYSILYGDEEIKKLAKLESDPNGMKESPPLTEYLYETQLKELLAKKVWEKLKSTHEIIKTYAKKLSKEQEELILAYLCRTKESVNEAQQFYDKIDNDKVKDCLALCSEEISHLLSHTLTRECDKNYGFDSLSKLLLALPFRAANTPNRGSQFANHHITMDYTFQTVIKKGISQDCLKHEIERLQNQAMQELKEGAELEKTEAWKLFCLISGTDRIPLFNLKGMHFEQILKRINGSVTHKLQFIEKLILPQMLIHDKKISWNPQNTVAFFKMLFGFTGTLWDSESMHPHLDPQSESGTDMKTIIQLWKKSRKTLHLLKEGSDEDLLSQLHKLGDVNIVDAAGDINKNANEDLAKKMSLQWKKPVIFWNSLGKQLVTDGSKVFPLMRSPWDKSECVAFYDQDHKQGGDIQLGDKAVFVVSIGRGMLLRDLLQAVCRARKLHLSQKIVFNLLPEAANLIRQSLKLENKDPILLDHILLYTIRNQRFQKQKNALPAIKQQLHNIPQMAILDRMLSDDLLTEQDKKLLEQLWVQPTNKSPRELYGIIPTEKASESVVEKEVTDCKKLLTDHFYLEKEDNRLELIDEIASRKTLLPECIINSSKESVDQSMEIEKELSKEVENELELNSNEEVEHKKLSHLYGFFIQMYEDYKMVDTNDYLPSFPISSYMNEDTQLKPYAKAFEDIHMTFNVLEWSRENNKSPISDVAFLGRYRIPFHHVYLNERRLILISQYEAREYVNDTNYYNLTLGFLDSKSEEGIDEEFLKKIIKLKFLNGVSSYSKLEQKILKEWIKQEGKELMQTLFLKHILAGSQKKISRYKNSILENIFAEQ